MTLTFESEVYLPLTFPDGQNYSSVKHEVKGNGCLPTYKDPAYHRTRGEKETESDRRDDRKGTRRGR